MNGERQNHDGHASGPNDGATEYVEADMSVLVERVRAMSGRRSRIIIGITGTPGAGKSTLAGELTVQLPGSVVVPMDGFHLSNQVLREVGTHTRKGAIDTFDTGGYRALLERLRAGESGMIYAPSYSREIEEPIAGSIPIASSTAIIITEGNYLLADDPDMRGTRPLFDEIWYLETDEKLRLPWLINRHIRFGKSPVDAHAWATGTDESNARMIRATRQQADLITHLPRLSS
jgi:pantothenate kinase